MERSVQASFVGLRRAFQSGPFLRSLNGWAQAATRQGRRARSELLGLLFLAFFYERLSK